MTILPKKKVEEESDSDGDDNSAGGPDESSPHGAAGHAPLNSPTTQEEVGYHSPEGFYHRRYDLSSSSGESSPELPSLSKRLSYRSPPAATASGIRGKKPLDTSPGYNSSEEYDGSRRPYVDPEGERQFENALRKERGLVINKMRPDGACLFRAVADQVYGDQEMHAVVRNNCMDYMVKNADYFSQYISDEDFDHYINRKRQDQCYGNNIEMQALAEMYNRPIEVYQYTTDPINIFFGVYKTDNAPLRLSYHGSIHYNSVIDPSKATVGVGLGLAGHKPGFADKMQLVEAQRDSENVQIEQAMLEDKKRSTDWEATYDAIEEAVARESYLTWLRESEKRSLQGGSQPSSSACRGNSPPTSSSLSFSPAPQVGGSPATSRKPPGTTGYRASTAHAETNLAKSRSSVLGHVTGSPSPNSCHRGGGLRRFTPSPPSSSHHRSGSGLGVGSGVSTVRNAPYYSPRDSPRSGGSLRGSARNSPPMESSRGHSTGCVRGVSRSPTPRTSPTGFAVTPPPQDLNHTYSGSSSAEASPNRSPASTMKPLLVNLNESVPLERTLSPYQTSPTSSHAPPVLTTASSRPLTLEAPPANTTPPPSPGHLTNPQSPPTTGSQSPPHTLNFEDGRVLSQLPYEYSSFLDLPSSALGLSEWEDDRLLAAVLAASQQEYIDSLRCSRAPSQGAEGQM